MKRKLYQAIAQLIAARLNCADGKNPEWHVRHKDRLEYLARTHLPSGSGFDAGTKIDLDASTPDKIVFNTSFHHMNQDGYYDGWTEHKITVTSCLQFGFSLRIGGRDKRQIKEYIHETFRHVLDSDIEA